MPELETETGEHDDGSVPERFVPIESRGELTEAEHLARYWWASQLAPGRKVLDAGCGVAYGSALLARAGASRVVGIDRAAAVVEAARATAPDGVDLRVGDVTDLPFDDDEFDLVVCFEVIEHLHDQPKAVAEFARVLGPDGVLVISSPNRDVYVPGNPHHTHEYTPDELARELYLHFATVELRRQHNWVTSIVADDRTFAADELAALDLRFAKVEGKPPGSETYTVGLASNGPLPAVGAVAVATGDTEVRHWLDLYDEQRGILQRQQANLETLNADLRQIDELREQLLRSEQQLARLPGLETDLHAVRRELEAAREAAREAIEWAEEAARQAREADANAHQSALRLERATRVIGEMQASPSWRLTAPLRALKRLIR